MEKLTDLPRKALYFCTVMVSSDHTQRAKIIKITNYPLSLTCVYFVYRSRSTPLQLQAAWCLIFLLDVQFYGSRLLLKSRIAMKSDMQIALQQQPYTHAIIIPQLQFTKFIITALSVLTYNNGWIWANSLSRSPFLLRWKTNVKYTKTSGAGCAQSWISLTFCNVTLPGKRLLLLY